METVVIVAIGVLAAIFLASLVTLVVVCNQRHCHPAGLLQRLESNGLMSHGIAVLKICHTLTEKLVAMTMGSGTKVKAPNGLSDIITVAKRINPRVDDVVRSMYPQLSPVLLDARATALFLSVSHLVLVTRHACHMSGNLDWIDQLLRTAEGHMVALREAALASETDRMQLGAEAVQQEHTI
ncbi:transmembrane protein 98-like isoform X2 [Paramormyrops kingsleyae]|uniref:transmembrane protein 98-like isoform X2 n=1 Tax=Paramormyrops kingsleyae TaxID=1676925 RepID=UPI000CD623B0|nr:transmembrane protein 98-like isoform X2 [Paramormyrops kingsleyae]